MTPENQFLFKLDTKRRGARVIKAMNELVWALDYLDVEKKGRLVAKQEADSSSDLMATLQLVRGLSPNSCQHFETPQKGCPRLFSELFCVWRLAVVAVGLIRSSGEAS